MGAFAPNTPYGRLAVEARQASAARYGGTVERATLVPEQGSDMDGMAREFDGNTSYDAVLLPYSGPGLNEAVRHLPTAGLETARPKLRGSAQWNQPSLHKAAQLKGGRFAAVHQELREELREAEGREREGHEK